jgi:uncharacterized protein YfkK (UPF0435 family)
MKKIFLTLTLALFVIPFGISQDLPSYVPTDGLVAYYPFNGNANDASGNGNHGAVDGATLTNDKYGNLNGAYSFVGSKEQGNSINLGGSIFNDPNSFSISITVNVGELFVHNNPFSYLFSQATGGEIQISQHPNYLGFSSKLNNSSWLTCEITPQIYHWVNYVYTYSEELNEIVVYTNGVETCSKEINSTLFSYNGPAMIGRQSNVEHNYFNGTISDIGFWNRALTEQEVQNLYTSSTGDILLNGVVSVENNQIKNVADPTDAQDVVTKNYTYSKTEVDALIANLQQQINEMNQTITSSELEGNWNVKELYYLNPDTNEITSTFPTPECSKPYQYYEFLASKEIFWTGIGTNWVTQSCTSNEFGVKQDPYTITTANSSGDDLITYINFPNGSNTRNWEVISRPSENTIIIRAWQNNEITLYNNEVYGLKLVKEARIEQNLN